ncbi:MAG: hypothetical protein ACK4RK_05345 [Gemmataceae bacterium]
MSTSPESQTDAQLMEQARRQVQRLMDEVTRLAESDVSQQQFFSEFLEHVLTAIAAPAGAVWMRTPQGNLQLQYQINIRLVGLDQSDETRQQHGELLRHAMQLTRPLLLPPHSGPGEGVPGAINPTNFVNMLVPIIHNQQVVGMIEVWQDPRRNPDAQRGFLQFLTRMAELASSYIRNQQMKQMAGQQQVWSQLEAFARQIHTSLNPTEVAYLTVNEARRLIECDRVSVAARHSRKMVVEAISGADVVEKRSSLVQLQRALCERVAEWGERLVFQGVQDDTLPPKVLHALDAYLEESNSKLLVILPLRDERELDKDNPKKKLPSVRSVMMMECFEPPPAAEPMIARLEVIGRHAASAMFNALEHKRIPLRMLWKPIMKVQDGLGGKARAITISIVVGLLLLIGAMIFVPYPLKMDAKGQLLPTDRQWTYSPSQGQVRAFVPGVEPGALVQEGMPLAEMFDPQLQYELITLDNQIKAAREEAAELWRQHSLAPPSEKPSIYIQYVNKDAIAKGKARERDALLVRTHSLPGEKDRGRFYLKSPMTGTILNFDFRETLTNRTVKPSDPLIRIGDKTKNWEIELRIPQKHIGQVLQAFENTGNAPLDVDLLLLTNPTQTYRGKLDRHKLAAEAIPSADDPNDPEPVVLASVRLEGTDIPKDKQLPRELLVTGAAVSTKVRCGNRAMGYSLFYGLWEFVYEKVIFAF